MISISSSSGTCSINSSIWRSNSSCSRRKKGLCAFQRFFVENNGYLSPTPGRAASAPVPAEHLARLAAMFPAQPAHRLLRRAGRPAHRATQLPKRHKAPKRSTARLLRLSELSFSSSSFSPCFCIYPLLAPQLTAPEPIPARGRGPRPGPECRLKYTHQASLCFPIQGGRSHLFQTADFET